MRRAHWPVACHRIARRFPIALSLVFALAAAGCGHQNKVQFAAADKPPTVKVVNPQVRNIVRVVGQPSFIESYERTSIFPKPSAYIEKWIVDIGDKVKKGDVLATLFVPELVEEYGTKKATVVLDEERIRLAREVVDVATADVKAADARLKEANAILDKYEAEVERWEAQVKRLQQEVDRIVVDSHILLESNNQLKSAVAARDRAKATIKKAEAELLSKRSTLDMANVAVKVAEAALVVAESEKEYAKAWVDYLTLTAPFPGVITARNANTFDFVLPATGDPSANSRAPHLSPGRGAAPIYVVDRTDIVRIFVDIPEQDANFVKIGTKATVLAKSYRDQPIPAVVTRTSWALNMKSRTLRAEIDLPNPETQLLPGMYAYAKVIIERPHVQSLPVAALSYLNDQAYCWTNQNGKAVRTEVRTGVSDGQWIEVTNRFVPAAEGSDAEGTWEPISGQEQVILGDLSTLTDGAPIDVAPEGTQLASKHASAATGATTTTPASGPVEAANGPAARSNPEL